MENTRKLREHITAHIEGVPMCLKSSILLAYALGYIDDAAFNFMTGLGSFQMDAERD